MTDLFRQMLESPSVKCVGETYPIVWSDAYKYKLSKIASGEEDGYSRIDQQLAPPILRCSEGNFDAAEIQILTVLKQNFQGIEKDTEIFISAMFALFVVQRLDVLAAMLRERFVVVAGLELAFESGGIGLGCIRWEISTDAKGHRFVFDIVNLQHDNTRAYNCRAFLA